MKSFKRIACILLIIALMITLFPVPAAADTVKRGTCGDDVAYTFRKVSGASVGVLTLEGTGPMYDYSYLGAPWNDYRTEIGEVIIVNGITSIGKYAFAGLQNLTKVGMGDSVKKINGGAFAYCPKLKTISFSESLEEIGVSAFQNCTALKEITLPDSLTVIYAAAFRECSALENVYMPWHLETLYSEAFGYCTSLREIYIWDQLRYIQEDVFVGCVDMKLVIYSMEYTLLGDEENYFGDIGEVTLAGYRFSPTQRYAKKYGYVFEDVGLPPNPFKDVKSGQFYYESVLWAYYQDPKVTSGTTDTTFEPDKKINRAQAVTFLWNAAGKPAPGSSSNPFNDVSSDAYYYKAVLWAYRKGITSGTSDTTFDPDKACTRAQVVTFLWNAAGKPKPKTTKNPFPDVKKGTWYYKAVLWAYENGVVSGFDDGTFGTNKTCTRGQFVTFLKRFMTKFPDVFQ